MSRRKRCSKAATARGVNALDTDRRRRVWSGGSTFATKLDRNEPCSPSFSLVSRVRLREIVSEPLEEKLWGSPYAARTSAWRVSTYAPRCSLLNTGDAARSRRRKA